MSQQARAIAAAAVFALLGPPLTGAGVTLVMVAPLLAEMPEMAWLALTGVLFGYVIGLPPALITGIAAAWLSGKVRSGWLWTAICMALGGLTAGIIAPMFQFSGGKLSVAMQITMLGGCGALAALVCALVCLTFRPRSAA